MRRSRTGTAPPRGRRGRRRLRRGRLVVLALAAACSYTPADLDVADPVLAQSTQIFAADGTLVTTLQAEENRENVRLDELAGPRPGRGASPSRTPASGTHRGVDVKAVLRAAVANTTEGEVVEGGSTITQQYVKNTLLDDDQTLHRKVARGPPRPPARAHLHQGSASSSSTSTPSSSGTAPTASRPRPRSTSACGAGDLDLAQAAMLAGLIRAPSAFDPDRRPRGGPGPARTRCSPAWSSSGWIDGDEAAAATAEDARAGRAVGRGALPGRPLRRAGQALRARRRDGASAPPGPSARRCCSAAGCASPPPSTSPSRPRPRRRSPAPCPTRRRSPTPPWSASSPPPATCGPWWAAGTSSAAGAQAKVDLAAGGPGRPAGLVVQALRAGRRPGRGHPARPGLPGAVAHRDPAARRARGRSRTTRAAAAARPTCSRPRPAPTTPCTPSSSRTSGPRTP